MASKLTIRLSDHARSGIDRMTREYGFTISAAVEAFGQLLAEDAFKINPLIVQRAREIDQERRNRR